MPATNNDRFYFVRHPKYDSFGLIQVSGELPPKLPKEIYLLMPGNKSGRLDGVKIEQDQKYLDEQVKTGCPRWFETLEEKEWEQVDNLRYRLVGTYLFM